MTNVPAVPPLICPLISSLIFSLILTSLADSITNPAKSDMLYSSEQFDNGLQMQYFRTRARYYNQNTGGFNSLEPFDGNMGDPQSLHKYAYTPNDPVNGIDPMGKFIYPWRIGQLAHTEIQLMYKNEHKGHFTTLDSGMLGTAGALMPDIMDYHLQQIAGIKPFSPYGLATGPPQLLGYLAAANGMNIDGGGWHGSTWPIGVRPIPIASKQFIVYSIANIGGLIFYKVFYKPISVTVGVALALYLKKKIKQWVNAFDLNKEVVIGGAGALILTMSHMLDIEYKHLTVFAMANFGIALSTLYLKTGIGLRLLVGAYA